MLYKTSIKGSPQSETYNSTSSNIQLFNHSHKVNHRNKIAS